MKVNSTSVIIGENESINIPDRVKYFIRIFDENGVTKTKITYVTVSDAIDVPDNELPQ